MLPIETFFAFGFVLSFAINLLSIWWYYLPKVISQYRLLVDQLEQSNSEDSFPKLRERQHSKTVIIPPLEIGDLS
jgi:hypothetical protein